MGIIKPDGKDGKFAFVTKGTEIDDASAEFAGGFALITAVGASSAFDSMKDSGIDNGEAVGVGDIVRLDSWEELTGNPLSEGDACEPLSIDFDGSCWVTDKGRSASRTLNDRTSQGNVAAGDRDYAESGIQEETGSISGFYALGSSIQREIDSHFTTRIVDADGKKTKVPIQDGSFLTAFCYRETTVAGEVEIWLFRKLFIQSVDDAGAPQNGNVPFNFSYTVAWKRQYERTIPAA